MIDGISDNVDFLSALMQHSRFRSGDITTGFIAEEYPDGFHGAPADEQLIADLAAIAGMVAVITDERAAEVSDQLGPPPHFPCERVVRIDGGPDRRVRIKPYKGGTLAVLDGEGPIDMVGRWVPGQRLLTVLVDGRKRIVQVRRAGRGWELQTRGATHKVQVLPPHVAELSKHMIEKPAPDLSRLLLAPMPGLLTQARRRRRRQGRTRPAGRGDGSDEDGKHPPRRPAPRRSRRPRRKRATASRSIRLLWSLNNPLPCVRRGGGSPGLDPVLTEGSS